MRTKIFLGWTSNLTSSGTRETIKYLCKNKMIDVLCTTAGGVEEDFIKCMKPTYLGDFALRGKDLRGKGLNRIGNLIQPNDNYCDFEDWIMPILDAMLREQNEEGVKWTCSSVIKRLGMEINHEDSIFYWAAKNDIPCYCPALTDGSTRATAPRRRRGGTRVHPGGREARGLPEEKERCPNAPVQPVLGVPDSP